jgi:hypothetical protein
MFFDNMQVRISLILLMTIVVPLSAGDDQDGITPVLPLTHPLLEDRTYEWKPALSQLMRFLFVQHGFRIVAQPKTRARLGGPFFADYADSVKALSGWGDGDNWFINYVGHPMQGAMSGYIQVQNDPEGRTLEFSKDKRYWRSRLKAVGWNAAYSTQFELGPISESSLGNVGQRKGTAGYVDLVMTPSGGFAVMLAEDALDRYVVRKWESRTESLRMRGFYRVLFNPSRAFANVLRGKSPWYRDARPLTDGRGGQ